MGRGSHLSFAGTQHMRTIAFFTTKGGAGRTISTMALASGFLALGKRVMVMDCTDQAGTTSKAEISSTLQKWRKAMSASQVHKNHLELTECWTRDHVEDALASADARGFDITLIDTRILPLEAQLEALGRADLILSPVIGVFEARHAVAGIDKYLADPDDVMGLISGCRNGAAEAAETRDAFGSIPVLQTELPWSEAIGDQILYGHIGHFTSMMACKSGQPGYGRFREAQAAWASVLKLTVEVQWALQGLLLAKTNPLAEFSFSKKVFST